MELHRFQSVQSLQLIASQLSSSGRPIYARSHSSSSIPSYGCKQGGLACRLGNRTTLFGCSSDLKNFGLKGSCSAGFNECSDEDLPKWVDNLEQDFYVTDGNENNYASAMSEISEVWKCDEGENRKDSDSSMSFLPSKLEFLEPNLLGIRPEPPEWPERERISRFNIERKANSVEIPLSLRMIKRKQKWQEGFVEAGDFAYCSVKKAFSCMVFMIRELQSYALQIRESLYSEDLKKLIDKVQMEIDASFVWLFQQVFSRTPTFMVYVMLFLANFTVHSMVSNVDIAVSPSPLMPHEAITDVLTREEVDQEQEQLSVDDHNVSSNNGGGGKTGKISCGTEGEDWNLGRLSPSIRYPSNVPNEIGEVSVSGNEETIDKVELWDLMIEQASRMQEESPFEVLDHETEQVAAPVNAKPESEGYNKEDFYRTDLLYQMAIAEDPDNPLLLSNYAQFLTLIPRDYDRAEECFKRAIMIDPTEAHILGKYADFLWKIRNDLWNAEERYQQAMAAESAGSNSHYFACKYARFLWNTGAADTCYPLDGSNEQS